MRTEVLIIGGGATGTCLARDLTLRGIPCVLVEGRDINAGASGNNHGLLHSGARYVATDPASALECRNESQILKRIAPQCIDDTGGLFAAVPGDDEDYIEKFPRVCGNAGVECHPLTRREALELEPGLNQNLIAAFAVNDAAINPFQLALDCLTEALQGGCRYASHRKVTALDRAGGGPVTAVRLLNVKTGKELWIRPELIVNASGAWSGEVVKQAGLSLEMISSKGTLAVTASRLCGQVINRLRPPDDGDILVPGGTVSILGTTSIRLDSLESIRPTTEEVDTIVSQGAALVPALESTRYIRSFAGVRPLIKSERPDSDRYANRGYALIDHADQGCPNLITITGGKLTTCRLMAEKAADLVAAKLGVEAACRTAVQQLPPSSIGRWTEPGRSLKTWLREPLKDERIICECEMVPQSHLQQLCDSLDEQAVTAELNAFRLRSRLGKGACQGTFCSVRLTNLLVDENRYSGPEALKEIKAFLSSRWAGQRPVLWGGQLIQAELSEALHCGLCGLELRKSSTDDA